MKHDQAKRAKEKWSMNTKTIKYHFNNTSKSILLKNPKNMKLKLKGTFFVATLLVFLTACQKNEIENNSLLNKIERYTETISTSPKNLKSDLKVLIEIRNHVAKNVLNKGIEKKELINSIRSKNIDNILERSGISKEENDIISSKLENLKNILINKYPELEEYMISMNKNCFTCDVEKQIAYINKIANSSNSSSDLISYNTATELSPEIEDIGADCRWVAYTACLLVCTTTGPVIYWICAALCVDTYCTFN